MTWTPHATVAVIIEDAQERFLLVEELSRGQVVFNQPAGHVEEDEAIGDAAIREALEETGWQVELLHLIGVYTYKAPANGVTYFRFCFSARVINRVSESLDEDIIAAHWMTLEQISSLGAQLRSPLVLQCIKDYQNGRRYPLDAIVTLQT